jgi:hypothetical protein
VKSLVEYMKSNEIRKFCGPGYVIKLQDDEKVWFYSEDLECRANLRRFPDVIEIDVDPDYIKVFGKVLFNDLTDEDFEHYCYNGQVYLDYDESSGISYYGNGVTIDIIEKEFIDEVLNGDRDIKDVIESAIKNTFPWINRKNVGDIEVIDDFVSRVEYKRGKIVIDTSAFLYNDGVEVGVLYDDGVYLIEVPYNYSGVDVFAVNSVSELPEEIKKNKLLDVKIPKNAEEVYFEFTNENLYKVKFKVYGHWITIAGDGNVLIDGVERRDIVDFLPEINSKRELELLIYG